MTDEFYIVAITALLPLMAVLLVLQVNPYQALVIRGILGAIAALIYTLFGAADVALTEALVGTMLSITLYAVAVRSSMVVRIGIVEASQAPSLNPDNESNDSSCKRTFIAKSQSYPSLQQLSVVEQVLSKHHVRVELVLYQDLSALSTALQEKAIHIAYSPAGDFQVRLQHLYDILQSSPEKIPNLNSPDLMEAKL